MKDKFWDAILPPSSELNETVVLGSNLNNEACLWCATVNGKVTEESNKREKFWRT